MARACVSRLVPRLVPVLVLAVLAVFATAGCGGGGSDATGTDTEVEIFSWWTGAGEKEGFDALAGEFRARNPDVELVNAAVAGGAGVNAKSVLASRLAAGDPPDSYQIHAGLELTDDIRSGKVDDLTALYDSEGWRDKFPHGLIDAITVDNRLYSVPVNIHRSNLLWYHPKTLADAGIAGPPATWQEFLQQAPVLRARGVEPLALGAPWTHKHLLENVLLAGTGPQVYTGLWNGTTDWGSGPVLDALRTYLAVVATADQSTATGEWQSMLDRVVTGRAAYAVMGDWADAYLGRSRNLPFGTGYAVAPAPGTAGVFNFLSDSFTLARDAPHPQAARAWLRVCGSVAGQDAFNVQKGSIPARTDADATKYRDYLATAFADWRDPATVVVGSLTHGVVANNAWNSAIDAALVRLDRDRDTTAFITSVREAYAATR